MCEVPRTGQGTDRSKLGVGRGQGGKRQWLPTGVGPIHLPMGATLGLVSMALRDTSTGKEESTPSRTRSKQEPAIVRSVDQALPRIFPAPDRISPGTSAAPE